VKPRPLSFRLAAAFLAFVVVGSLALVWWLGMEEVRQSRAQFAALAETNAKFLRTQNLPPTERTAQSLREVLGVEVYFWRGKSGELPVEFDRDPTLVQRLVSLEGKALTEAIIQGESGVHAAHGGEAVRIEYEPGKQVAFFRPAPDHSILRNPRTLAMLAAFWLLSLGLAGALARGIVRPLRELAQRLPAIADERADFALPEITRADEIGDLARAYAGTREQLVAERRARQQAEQLATLGRMATGLAHEINNPISAIKLHTQLLEQTGPAGTAPGLSAEEIERQDRLKIILDEAAKIEGLVSQWMFLARPQPPQTIRCDLAELIALAVQTHRPAADHARVRLVNEATPGLFVQADRRRLGQAIANVVINAIHAMAARGGTLIISSPPPSAPQTSAIRLRFSDTGPGFSEAALGRATELLYSEKEGGMGIGLSVTAEILRAHGGELILANAPAGGAILTFILPAADPKIP
jgi:signal transduction histidine kinase